MNDIVTTKMDEHFDVRHRLVQLRQWREEGKQEDQQLLAKARQLDGTKALHVELGSQIGRLRKRLKVRRIKEPLEIPATITEQGLVTLQQLLAEQFVQLSKEERLLWLENFLFIMTPDLWRLFEKIKNVLGYYSFGQQRNFLLGGPSGMGKTTFLNWLCALNLPIVEKTRNYTPLIKVDAPVSKVTPKALLRRLILECGQVYFKSDNEEDLLDKLDLFLQQCGAELMMFDEIEQLSSNEMRRRLLDISNRTQDIPIICASCNPTQWTLGDVEVAGRWNDYFELSPYTGDRICDLLAFIEQLLPFSQPSNLAIYKIARPKPMDGPAKYIEQWTDGTLRNIMILIRDASRRAIEEDFPCLSFELLERTWKDIQTKPVTRFLDKYEPGTEDEAQGA